MRNTSKVIGAVLVLSGLALLLVGAQAAVHAAPAEATADALPDATAPPAEPLARLAVVLHALGVAVEREAEAPLSALPADTPTLERHVETPALGLDAGASLVLETGDAAARDASQAGVQSASLQRAPASDLPVVALAAGAAALTAAGVVAWCWSSIKTWGARLLPLVPLYARIRRADVFENDVRGRIFAAVKTRPGIAATDLAREVGVSWGTTMYHLEVLEQNRMVTSLRNGRHRRYFANGAQLDLDKQAVAVLQNAVTSDVARVVAETPGASQKDLAERLGMTPQALHWHLVRLVGAGLVRKERDGRVVRHYRAA